MSARVMKSNKQRKTVKDGRKQYTISIGESPEAGKILDELKMLMKDLKDQRVVHDRLGFFKHLITV